MAAEVGAGAAAGVADLRPEAGAAAGVVDLQAAGVGGRELSDRRPGCSAGAASGVTYAPCSAANAVQKSDPTWCTSASHSNPCRLKELTVLGACPALIAIQAELECMT